METIEINGKSYLIDIEKATERGLLKEKDNKPRSWEEYCSQINYYDYDTFSDGEEAKAFIALGRLIQLRDVWWEDWRPNWTDCNNLYVIRTVRGDTILADCYSLSNHILVFPTQAMRDDFLETFRNLIEQAKMFL